MKRVLLMKQVLVILALILFLPVSIHAQNENNVIPVDWKEVRKVAENEPQRIKELVAKLSADEIDSTMTWNERILGYYGQSFLTPMTEINEGRELDKLLKEGKPVECLAGAKELLKKNPVSLKALSNAIYAMFQMFRDSTNHDISRDEARNYYLRMHAILNTIAKTGEGTEKRPFYVTAVSDEYVFMRHYLEINNRKAQYMTEHFDVFELEETSKYFSQPKLYFEITRVLEIEKDMFLK